MDQELDYIKGKPVLRNPSSANWRSKLSNDTSPKKSRVAYPGSPAVRLSGLELKVDESDEVEKERV